MSEEPFRTIMGCRTTKREVPMQSMGVRVDEKV
jgi:hypothetical protein